MVLKCVFFIVILLYSNETRNRARKHYLRAFDPIVFRYSSS